MEPIKTIEQSIWGTQLPTAELLEGLVEQYGYIQRIGAEAEDVTLYELMKDGWVVYQWKAITRSEHRPGDGGNVYSELQLLQDGQVLLVSKYNDTYSTLCDDSMDSSSGAIEETQLFFDDAFAVALYEKIEVDNAKN